MKTLIGIVLRLYPSEWRERYGEELRALAEDSPQGPAALFDLIRGGLVMRLTAPSFPRLALFLSVAGLAIGSAFSFLIPNVYESRATMRVVGEADTQQRVEFIEKIKSDVTTRRSLATLIQDPRLNLYRWERSREPLEDVEDEMRRNITILIDPGKAAFTVGFRYGDRKTAQLVVQSLVAMFINAAPGPFELLDPPSTPQKPISPNRAMIAAAGFTGGFLLAGVLSLFGRRPQSEESADGTSFPKLALLLSIAGLAIGGAGSFLLPNVYRATAVLRVNGPADVRAEMLSRSSLAALISDPRLNLYARERSNTPLEDVVDKARGNIHIERRPATPVFVISFDYRDRRSAQLAVQALVGRFTSLALPSPVELLDPPVVPQRPIYPNRALIAATGFAAGFLLAAAIAIFRRRPQPGAFTDGHPREA